MNGIDDLRRALEDRAAGVSDDDLGVRAGSVHRRVRGVRRRRRTVTAAGAAALVAVVAGISLLDGTGHGGQSLPADRIVGIPAPAHLAAVGVEYAFDRGIDGHAGSVSVDLAASDRPRLVSWATSDDRQDVRVSGTVVDQPYDATAADFSDWVLVPSGSKETVTVTAATGQPGLAVYTVDATLGRGDRLIDGVTFRGRTPTSHLLAAAVGQPGQAELTVPATADSAGVEYHVYCVDAPRAASLSGTTGADGRFSDGRCQPDLPREVGSGGYTGFTSTPGEDLTTTARVTLGAHGSLVTDPDLRIVIAIYGSTYPSTATPPLVEASGHTWQRAEIHGSKPGERQLSATAPSGRGEVYAVIDAGAIDSVVSTSFDGRPGPGLGGGSTGDVVSAGSAVALRFDARAPRSGDRLTIAFYVRAD